MAPTIQNLAQNKPIAPKPMAPDVQSDSPQARQISDNKRQKMVPRRRCSDHRASAARNDVGRYQQGTPRAKCTQLSPALPELP
ncbi:hypothetical protein ACJ73_01626 [Blastomyces percursus]|uniref:Uncharacterized protein n=1 Tax=Blastomyces percursus TaxID=1658174 RepID=A0A1J9QET7_9EURO|nr:hypothetical protein ACJ73_01626 [Blastomyces percursus]